MAKSQQTAQRSRPVTRRALLQGAIGAAGASAAALSTAFASARSQFETPDDRRGNGLFSWHDDVVTNEAAKAALFETMRAASLEELYQYVSRDTRRSSAEGFFAECAERGVRGFVLAGEPEWGLDEKAEDAVETIRWAGDLGHCAGIVLDVETHLLDAWRDDPSATREAYVSAMRSSRRAAERTGLELVTCVPFYLDEDLGADLMAKLVEKGCHALAVMNYLKADEAAHIETEARLCSEFGKPLVNVYELQAAGSHGLVPANTYHDDGMGAVAASWERLKAAFPDQVLSYAIHDYDALAEVTARA